MHHLVLRRKHQTNNDQGEELQPLGSQSGASIPAQQTERCMEHIAAVGTAGAAASFLGLLHPSWHLLTIPVVATQCNHSPISQQYQCWFSTDRTAALMLWDSMSVPARPEGERRDRCGEGAPGRCAHLPSQQVPAGTGSASRAQPGQHLRLQDHNNHCVCLGQPQCLSPTLSERKKAKGDGCNQ